MPVLLMLRKHLYNLYVHLDLPVAPKHSICCMEAECPMTNDFDHQGMMKNLLVAAHEQGPATPRLSCSGHVL